MPAFATALRFGQRVELLVLDRIHVQDPKACIIQGSFSPFDIYIPETHTRVEVKSDQKSMNTGNYLIEVHHYGKPSALLTTEADIWALYDGSQLVWVKPSKIKDTILKNGYRQRTLIGDGDKVPKRCYLIPKDDINQIADYIEEIDEHKYK